MNARIKIRNLLYGLALTIIFSSCCDSKLNSLEKNWVVDKLIVNGHEKTVDSLIINMFSFRDDGICSFPVPINVLSMRNDGKWSVVGWKDQCVPKVAITHDHNYYNGTFEVYIDEANGTITLQSEKVVIEGQEAFNIPF